MSRPRSFAPQSSVPQSPVPRSSARPSSDSPGSSSPSPLLALMPLILLFAMVPVRGASAPTKGRITDVTLYQGQALVTRSIPVEGDAGSLEVVVTDLPESVIPESLFAEGGHAIDVRAVRFRRRAVGAEPREEVRRLDEAMDAARTRLEVNGKTMELLLKKLAYLDKLESFVVPTAGLELSRGVLDATTLERITLFAFDQRQGLLDQQIALAAAARELGEEISLLERQRAELTGSSSRAVKEAVLFLEKSEAGEDAVRLNYLVQNCGWSPSYVFRAGADGKEARVEYNAIVQQLTGEDWSAVSLSLSTASPALSASGPGLGPFYVSLARGMPQPPGQQAAQEAGAPDVASQVKSIQQRRVRAIFDNRAALNLEQNLGSSWEANAAANDFQRLELVAGKELMSTLKLESEQEGPSLGYSLPGTVSLASRDDQQMVRVLEATLESRMVHVATPVLSSHIYREAEIANTSGQDLLGGPITAYLDGRFVGRGEIPTVARGQTFVVGFGADPQLRARRDLLSKTEGVQGGNREIGLRVGLSVESFKEEPVKLRLLDRLPYSSSAGQVRVTLKDPSEPLSQEALYQRMERPKGLLRWDIEVPARATGEEARTVEYSYTAEFDRNFELTAPGSTPRLQEEFQEMLMQRAKY